MAFIRELVTRLGFQMDDAEARRYEKRFQNLGKKIRGVGRSLALFVTAPMVALGGSFIKAAADAEETESKFREVFRGINDEADTMAKTLSEDFDLANVTAQEMLSTTGSLLVQFGFTTEAALEMSKQVSALSVDIASFENVQGGAERASQAITKALLGEREMLKGINKVVLEEDVTKKIAILRAQGMTFETNRQAKAIATLTLVTEQSERAIGDYSRTQDSATNKTRALTQKYIDLSVKLGKVLLPAYTKLVDVLGDVVDWMNSFTPAGRKTILIIAGIAAALGPLLWTLGLIIGALKAVLLWQVLAVAAVGALFFLIGDDIRGFLAGEKSVLGEILKGVDTLAESIEKRIKKLVKSVIKDINTKWVELWNGLMDVLPESVKTTFGLTKITPPTEGGGIGTATAAPSASMGERRIRGFGALLEFFGAYKPVIDPNLAGAMRELDAQRSREASRQIMASNPEGGAVFNINAPITVNPPPGTPAGEVAKLTAEMLDRQMAESFSRSATAARMAP